MAQPGPPPPSASLEQTRLVGHIGHLTAREEAAVLDFKKLCAEQGFYQPPNENSPGSHDDGTLVRYLRARKFIPQDAFVQFKDTEIWRKENQLDALYEQIDINDYQEARSVYPQWTGRRDKRGIPVYLYEVGKLNSKKMAAYAALNSRSTVAGLRLFALYENLTRFVMPLCSAVPGRPNPETPVDQSNNIVDISKVGLKQFWNLRNHMQDASTLATAHYPETLDRIFIIGAPSFFPTVWGWIKKWFDPITTSKIFIIPEKEVLRTLSAFIDIENIPKKYGGGLDFECGVMPVLDKAVLDVLTLSAPGPDGLKKFLTEPVRWIDGSEGDLVALGVGSVGGVARKEKVATLQADAARNAFSPPGTPGVGLRSDYFGMESLTIQDQLAPNPTPLQTQPVAGPATTTEPIAEKPGPHPAIAAPIAAQGPVLVAQPVTVAQPPSPDKIPQNTLAQNPVEQDLNIPPPVPAAAARSKIENPAAVAAAAAAAVTANQNISPPFNREISTYVTPPTSPSEILEKR